MIRALLLLAMQGAVTPPEAVRPAADSFPRITLAEAINRATRLDPNYVQALGRVDNAEWGRRAAISTFVLPAISATLDATKYSTAFFNIGTGRPQDRSVVATLNAQYELLSLRKIADLGRTGADLDAAEASALQQRFRSALETEADYYGALQNQELARVSRERARRAQEALGVARARVVAGAAVRSDSLQLVLELTQARTDQIRQDAALRVSRLQLGRRVGIRGEVAAEPGDTVPAVDLPLTLAEAVRSALDQGPQYRAARAAERAASAEVRARQSGYLPSLFLSGSHQRFDVKFFPGAANVTALTLTVSLPIWDNGQREIALSQSRVNRDVARAVRADLERAAERDVTQAYDAYGTARAAEALSSTGVLVARENFRVQESRYRGGATDILNFLDAQLRLTQAEADLVQSRYASRLSLAGLEAILGRRLLSNMGVP